MTDSISSAKGTGFPRVSNTTAGFGSLVKPPAKRSRNKITPAAPMSAKKFLVMALIMCCRKYLFVDIWTKIVAYLTLVVLGSIITDFYPLPKVTFVSKTSILNLIVVNAGLLVTLAVVGVFVFYSCSILSVGSRRILHQQFARLVVAFVQWFIVTKVIFNKVEHVTGHCNKGSFSTKKECTMISGGRWIAFDMSGHLFLLMFCSLMIMEEAVSYKCIFRLKDILARANDAAPELDLLQPNEVDRLRELYNAYGLYARISFVALAVVEVLWDIMIVITVLYYHNFTQKICGAAFAIGCWWLTYSFWYRKEHSPGMPGRTLIRFNRRPQG